VFYCEVETMKQLTSAILIAASLLPLTAFAQEDVSHVTRAQVRAELAQLESVGYNPAARDENYPQALQAAEAKVAARYGDSAAFGGTQNTQSTTNATGSGRQEASRQ
jgi:hypothetical protein